MFTQKEEENLNIIVCEKCDFKCKRLSNWQTHISTRKHLNNEKIVELLLKYRAYPHTTPYDMYSPLSSACFLNNKKIVDLLQMAFLK